MCISRFLESGILTSTIVGTIDVPFDKLSALNKSQDAPWFRSNKGGVVGGLEVFHSLHCLDMVRQYTWRDQYDYSDNPTFQDDDEFLRDVRRTLYQDREISY